MARASLQKVAGIREVSMVALGVVTFSYYFMTGTYAERVTANQAAKGKLISLNSEKRSLEGFIKAVTSKQGVDTLSTLRRSPDIKTQLLTGEKKNQFSEIGHLYLVWLWNIFICSILQFLNIEFIWVKNSGWIWSLT